MGIELRDVVGYSSGIIPYKMIPQAIQQVSAEGGGVDDHAMASILKPLTAGWERKLIGVPVVEDPAESAPVESVEVGAAKSEDIEEDAAESSDLAAPTPWPQNAADVLPWVPAAAPQNPSEGPDSKIEEVFQSLLLQPWKDFPDDALVEQESWSQGGLTYG